MSQPTVPEIVERGYDLLRPYAIHDSDENGWALLLMVICLLGSEQLMWQLTEDPGLAATLRPEQAPADWLDFVGSINGSRLAESMTTAEKRVEIRHPSGWARGLPSTILANVAKHLQPGATPVLRRRQHPIIGGPRPAGMILYVPWSQIVPGHIEALVADFQAQQICDDDGWVVTNTWGREATEHTTWGAAAAAHDTWGSMARGH